ASLKSSENTTTKIAFTSRSVAALPEKDLASRRPPMPSFTMLGGTIAAVCSRCQSQRNYEFAMDRRLMELARMLAYVTRTVDQELLLQNEYLAAENRILKAQLKGRL